MRNRFTRLAIVAGVTVLGVIACTGRRGQLPEVAASSEARMAAGQILETIVVEGPMVVGFFPPADSIDEHLDWGLDNTASCAVTEGVAVRAVAADLIYFIDGARRLELQVPTEGSESQGCYLIGPGREPMLVQSGLGPSYLVRACPCFAATYFHLPSCRQVGWVCCPDGRMDGEGIDCDS